MKSDKNSITEMFDSISESYDHLNHLLSLGIDRMWRRKTAKAIGRNHPDTILDIATGTADMAIALAKRCPDASIYGIDRSEKMIAIGNRKIKENDLDERIHLSVDDAENISSADLSFDAVSIAFGVRNFQDMGQGLSEAFRVLRHGGHIAILEFSTPSAFPFNLLYKYYFKHLLPKIGAKVSRNEAAYAYLPKSVYDFPPANTFISMMESAGFTQVKKKPLSLGIAILYTGQRP